MFRSDVENFKVGLKTHAPLIWYLIPICAGYLLAPFVIAPHLLLLFTPIILLLALKILKIRIQSKPILSFFIFLVALYYYKNSYPNIPFLYQSLPDREAEITIKIDQIYKEDKKNKKISGIATIIAAPSHLSYTIQSKTYFSAKNIVELNSLTKGSSVSVLAVLSKTKQTKHLHHLNSSFDESLSLQGIYYRLSRVRLKEILDTPFIAKKKKNLHNLILSKIQSAPHLDNEKKWRNILLALISGEKTFLPQRETLLYKWSGTMHIFTISGLHIGILAVLIYKLLSLFIYKKTYKSILVILLLFLFVELTGSKIAAYRAFWMATILLIAPIISRKGCLFSALLTAALLELILKPSVIWNLGFQLSYSVVFMILKLGLPTAKLYEEKIQPYKFDPTPNWISKCRFVLKKNVFTSLILTLSAFLPSTILLHPITHMVSILSIPLNLLIVPILPVLLTLGLTIYPVSMVHPILASPLKLISDFTIKTTTQLIEIFLQIPLSHYFLSSTLPFLSKLIPLLMVLNVLFFQNPTYKWISTILLWLLYFTTEIMV